MKFDESIKVTGTNETQTYFLEDFIRMVIDIELEETTEEVPCCGGHEHVSDFDIDKLQKNYENGYVDDDQLEQALKLYKCNIIV